MKTAEIRRRFLHFFRSKQHHVIASSSVVPANDPTLLFVNAGMNQFKDAFLGKSLRDYTRAATSQKCVRVGGKHNDLENVGHTSRHLTFFEMLGNFSFGDYFKKDAIDFAYEFAVNTLEFNPEQIFPTVFRDDEEAFALWEKYFPAHKITRFGEKENFWAMGDTGPCGPCSELLFDRGPKYGSASTPKDDVSGERFLEFWNLVFMQFDRSADGSLRSLPKPSIDTGSGLERLAALLQGVDNVFETDILRALIANVETASKKQYIPQSPLAPAFCVIADHLRLLSFAIVDGAQPSNVDRGYVLRKVLRRAVRYGKRLGFNEPFLASLVPCLVSLMGEDYPELKSGQEKVQEILTIEEEAFFKTLHRGGRLLEKTIDESGGGLISGDAAFLLKDTYGFPLEEVELLAKDYGLNVDLIRYRVLEQEAKERSRQDRKAEGSVGPQAAIGDLFEELKKELGPTVFVGYEQLCVDTHIVAIVQDGKIVSSLLPNEEGFLFLEATPFYAEMGGQVGDSGFIDECKVVDCKALAKGLIAHKVKAFSKELVVGSRVKASVDKERRTGIQNNHTATHLLHWALSQTLGDSVRQAGSLVEQGHVRFDFNHHKALSAQEIEEIEKSINAKISENAPVQSYERAYADVQGDRSIKQFFGDKYGSFVRVVDIGGYSKELCGGTHTKATGTIAYFRIVKEASIASGVRRIEAVTGQNAHKLAKEHEEIVTLLCQTLKSQAKNIVQSVEQLLCREKELQTLVKTYTLQKLTEQAREIAKSARVKEGISMVCAEVSCESKDLAEVANTLAGLLPSFAFVLGCKSAEKVQVIARMSPQAISKGLRADAMLKELSPCIGGGGGGKEDLAQAGGKNPQGLSQALEKAQSIFAKV